MEPELMNWEGEFEKLLNAGDLRKAFDFLYDNRNTMSKTNFDDCLVVYGQYVYREG